MRARGISYDTGFARNGTTSREPFDLDTVRHDLRAIRDDLHCTAVRVMGGVPERLETTAEIAAGLGLEVWFSPYPLELGPEEMLALFADCAERAERLRRTGAGIVYVTGAELCLMGHGFLPGATIEARVESLLRPDRPPEVIPRVSERVNAFLARAVPLVRARFGGPVTYAAVPLERVDWTPFDIVSADLYRTAQTADRFADDVRNLVTQSRTAQGKPVAITEFGAAGYQGAGDRGAQGMEIVEYDPDTAAPLRLDGVYVRDEAGQAAYLRELLDVFDAAGVDAAFVFTFALHDFPHRPDGDPRLDLDLAGYGIVKVRDDGTWEPKEAFAAVAGRYAVSTP